MNTNIFLLLLCIVPLTTIYGQNVGIHTPTPKTTLEAKSRVIVRDVRPFDENLDMYSLYVAQTDFNDRYDGVPLTAKKGQLIKIKTQSNYKIFTYELYLKVGEENCNGCEGKWSDWIDMYNTGVDYEKYAMFITEANLFRVDGGPTASGQNQIALVSHKELGGERLNPQKIVYLTQKTIGDGGRTKRYILHADYRGGQLFKASKSESPNGFYWKIRFVIIDRSIIGEIDGQTYTMRTFSNTANDNVNNALAEVNINKQEYPNDLFVFEPSENDLKTSVNSNKQPEAVLDVYGNMSITETNDAWPTKTTIKNLSPVFVDNDGYLYSFNIKHLRQRPFNRIEGYINTVAGGTFETNRSNIGYMTAPDWPRYRIFIGNKDYVGAFDTRIPYKEHFLLTTNLTFGNYEFKRRYTQMIRDRNTAYGARLRGIPDEKFALDNWYSTYTLYGDSQKKYTKDYPDDIGYSYNGFVNSLSYPFYPTYPNKKIGISRDNAAYATGEELKRYNRWSYIFGMGHFVSSSLTTYNSYPTSLLFPSDSKNINGANVTNSNRGKTWHLSLDYPNAEPIFGLYVPAGSAGIVFQPTSYQEYEQQFYWKYNLISISRSLIKDLGVIFDDMTYYYDQYKKSSYTNKDYYTKPGSVRNPYPAVIYQVFLGETLPFLQYMSGEVPLNKTQENLIRRPIDAADKSNIEKGYISGFEIKVSAESNKSIDIDNSILKNQPAQPAQTTVPNIDTF